ncbi:MAG: zinc D-Ala-D-Ala dipeptidase [Pseudonocardiales bacterium]|nr:zinc D-Ala-D-Ala dipeptidase [Pseudonocardiales bacterium]
MVIRRPLAALAMLALLAGCTSHGGTTSPGGPASPVSPVSSAEASSTTGGLPGSSATLRSRPSTPTRTPVAVSSLSAQARAAGLVDIRSIVPDAIVDLRYATSDNFVGVRLYPAGARCLVHSSMAAGLVVAARQSRSHGELLVFWDCYRPHAVQVRMFQLVPDPNWVARPGPYARSHEAARSVDVTLAGVAATQACPLSRRVQGHCLLDMGTDFDDFSVRAHAFAADGVTAQQHANRARLRAAMNAGGITVYSGEWWHFDGPGSAIARPQLDVPLT